MALPGHDGGKDVRKVHARYESTQDNFHQALFDKLSEWDVAEVRLFADLLARFNEDFN